VTDHPRPKPKPQRFGAAPFHPSNIANYRLGGSGPAQRHNRQQMETLASAWLMKELTTIAVLPRVLPSAE